MGQFPLVERASVSADKEKPVFDEQTLAKLLEAAFVLQEHNRELREVEVGLGLKRNTTEAAPQPAPIAPKPKRRAKETEAQPAADYTFTLAKIVETQHQIQIRHLELEKAMSLVAERLTAIARAGGASIGILNGKKVRYHAAFGEMTLPAGSEISMEQALCVACLRTGQVMRCVDVNAEFLLDPDECRRRGIESVIAVPVFHNGEVAGGIEVYYPDARAFTEQDVHSCQLMAGLITEALSRELELFSKTSLANERAVMLEALEKLKPNLTSLVDAPAAKEVSLAKSASGIPSVPEKVVAAAVYICRKCGHGLVGPELFCGKCGTPRGSDSETHDLQAKVAALLEAQDTTMQRPTIVPTTFDHNKTSDHKGASAAQQLRPELELADSIEEEAPELFGIAPSVNEKSRHTAELVDEISLSEIESTLQTSATSTTESNKTTPSPYAEKTKADAPEQITTEQTALVKPDSKGAWRSAASARDFLEQLAETKRPGGLIRFWNNRRGDIYLAIAVILVAGVIRWGIWSNHSPKPTAKPATDPASPSQQDEVAEPDISPFDRLLISLGLAEPPKAPEKKGNPDTKVWVDTHSALYYCPGADLYGKTPKGKFTSQREAQFDQYQPAYRKPCD
jgi:GAF domain-containing protein